MSIRPTRLHLQMAGAVVGVAIVTAGLLVGVWGSLYGVLVLLGVTIPGQAAFVGTAGILVTIGYLESRQVDRVQRLADAHPVDRETAPELHQRVTRVASQLDVPVPTIAVSERTTPEALVVGFRPSTVQLVLSLGTIDALDGNELEAVIAHELAHVKNRDAIVMTVVSLPVVVAGGLRSRTAGMDNPGAFGIVTVPLAFVSSVVWVVGRTLTARLSRTRERAADQAAVAVTGSPAALASALSRLDREVSRTPTRDLREASAISSLSILSLDPRTPEKIMLGPEGDTEPSHWWLRTRLHRLERWLFETHPPTSDRIESLSSQVQ